jgi:cephalosporin hydroxylase
MLMSQGTTACLEWKGKPLFKTVFDYAMLPMLLWELKPATVFEIGSGAGASAIWMADTMKGFWRKRDDILGGYQCHSGKV